MKSIKKEVIEYEKELQRQLSRYTLIDDKLDYAIADAVSWYGQCEETRRALEKLIEEIEDKRKEFDLNT